MKFIYVLEDDERIQRELFESIQSIDPKLGVRIFPSLSAFHEWLKISIHSGPKGVAQGGEKYKDDTTEDFPPTEQDELRLVIAKYEFFAPKNIGLIKRARDFFIRKKMCSVEDPTALIFTAFDSPTFDISLAEERIVNNVIFKPFDKLILKQHLEYALTGHHPVETTTVASMKLSSTIEMLKEVCLSSLSEVGFTTVNNHEIKQGALTKYYSDVFKTDEKRSVFAYCHSCKELPSKDFLCEFHFFGIDLKQTSQIRRQILTVKNHESSEIPRPKPAAAPKVQVLILDEDVGSSNESKSLMTERFSNTEVYVYNHYTQLLSDISDKETAQRQQLPQQFDIVVANYDLFQIEKEKRWDSICKLLRERQEKYKITSEARPQLFLTSKLKIAPDDIKEMAAWTKELFFSPLDKSYAAKKLLLLNPSLVSKEAVSVSSIPQDQTLKVANPVEITQISEAGLVLKYYRPLGTGAFREFILWRPQELEISEITGTVNFTEKDKNGGDFFLNHFVFFGMRDYYLKHIRLWLLDAYIKTKESA